MDGLNWLTAREAARGVREGLFSATDLARACLAQIDAREHEVQAWTFLDPDYVLRQAQAADDWRAAGNALGALHGVPVGIKDIIDTRERSEGHEGEQRHDSVYRHHPPPSRTVGILSSASIE